MSFKSLAGLISAFSGIALLTAGLFFDYEAVQPGLQGQATPTRDRLAQPTLPASPSQADQGAQVYWLACLPCHGDLGQGLTGEFIQTYPPEDRNCWESGCHGERPYENGFKLPATIPAVIGVEALGKFSNAAGLQAYIKAAMPYWRPGSLTDEEAWAVTAFILRESGVRAERTELDASNASRVQIHSPDLTATPLPASGNPLSPGSMGWLAAAGLFILVLFIGWLRRTKAGADQK